MAGNTSLSDDDDFISHINITPLVDVFLVLLIIFLITAPVIYQSAIKVQLPKATTGEQAKKSPLQFSITKSGEVRWNDTVMDWKGLSVKLREIEANAANETAVISADQGTPHGTVVRLMDLLRKHGLIRFALNVDSTGK